MGETVKPSASEAECTLESEQHVEELRGVLDTARMRGQLGEHELIRATQEYARAKYCIELNTATSTDILRILTLGANAHYGNAVIEEAIGAQTLLDLSAEGAIQIDLGLRHALSERAAGNSSDAIYVQRGADGIFHRVSWHEMAKRELQQRFGSLPEEPTPVIEEIPVLVPKMTAQAKKRARDLRRAEKMLTAER